MNTGFKEIINEKQLKWKSR